MDFLDTSAKSLSPYGNYFLLMHEEAYDLVFSEDRLHRHGLIRLIF